MFPEDFWPTVGMDGRVIVKVLEHEPGVITQPHMDGYHITKELSSTRCHAFTIIRVVFIWLKCVIYKFDCLCVGILHTEDRESILYITCDM